MPTYSEADIYCLGNTCQSIYDMQAEANLKDASKNDWILADGATACLDTSTMCLMLLDGATHND